MMGRKQFSYPKLFNILRLFGLLLYKFIKES